MKIERAVIEDAPGIMALQKLAYRSEAQIYNDFSIQPLMQTLEDLKGEFQSHDVFKAIRGKNLVGSVRTRVSGGTCYVGKLIVHPEYRNQGIGSALMAHIESHNSAVKRFELFTGHLSARNLYLYEKLGYRVYKREKAGDHLTLIFLEKVPEAT
ncbi:MAG: GNAT family N-acetyltransferase [Syntrophobacteraceae bacterium]|jgi:ribosomal protein S18 acetylase RimI-like enzyme